MKSKNCHISKLLSVMFVSAIIAQHTPVQAQVLEEVIVTAQRRVQSLQDVPISIDTVTGTALREFGFRDLRNMAKFTPGLILDENGMEDNATTIRGAGTGGKNRGMESAAPTFVDGIHFGRPSSNRSAFLDIERVEVLKGPQPVFFGQNASAGAISILSKRPGTEREGYLEAEIGRFGSRSFEGAITLPVTDTFGLRFAGRMEKTDGHLRDWFTGDAFPNQDIKVGRVVAQWTPTDRFQATAKFEYSDQEFGDDQYAWYLNSYSATPDLRYPKTVLLTGYTGSNVGPAALAVGDITRLGMRNGPLYVRPLANVTVANTSTADRGVWDTTTRTPQNMSAAGPGWRGYDAPEPFLNADFSSITNSKPYNGYLELDYELTDQIQLTSLTGYSNLGFDTVRGATSPWATGNRFRGEEFDQWSQELRLTSDTGGAFEWMVGAYWQLNNLNTQSDSWEANQRFAMRGNRAAEDSEWLSAFAAITYNINEQFSIDLGGRYSEIVKEGWGYNVEAFWIVRDPDTGLPSVRPTGVSMPANFHLAPVLGRTPYRQGPSPAGEEGVYGEVREKDFNPQVVLRYRPTEDLSAYVKYAKATKAGGFDTGVAFLPTINEDFTFDRETTTIYEGGLRASVFDGAGEVGVTVFKSTFEDLQLSSQDLFAGPPPGRNRTHNAGEQKSDGVEITGRYAFSDRLTGSMSLAYMDAVMLDFAGATCTEDEQVTGLCTDQGGTRINRSGQPARNAPEWSGSAQFNYWMPVTDNYKADLSVNMMASDGWIYSANWEKEDMMPSHWDASTSVTFSDTTDTYSLMLFARNLNSVKPKYYPEFDITDTDGVSSVPLGQNALTTYGVRIGYRF